MFLIRSTLHDEPDPQILNQMTTTPETKYEVTYFYSATAPRNIFPFFVNVTKTCILHLEHFRANMTYETDWVFSKKKKKIKKILTFFTGDTANTELCSLVIASVMSLGGILTYAP